MIINEKRYKISNRTSELNEKNDHKERAELVRAHRIAIRKEKNLEIKKRKLQIIVVLMLKAIYALEE